MEPQEINQLLTKYRPDILNRLLILTRDIELAEDLCQDTCLRAVGAIKRGKYKEGSFFGWLITIANNIFFDYKRRMGRNFRNMPSISIDKFENANDFLLKSYDTNIVTQIEYEEEKKIYINKLLETISKEQKRIIIMRYYEGMKFKDIAKKIKMNQDTMMSKHFRAIRKMRKAQKKPNHF